MQYREARECREPRESQAPGWPELEICNGRLLRAARRRIGAKVRRIGEIAHPEVDMKPLT